ncbi:hypothetical protein LVJ83_07355 [Uruburuella testudinis]|uniref:Uncharacterized protein n=1 Tax=Uruburuella testudinis TaxID=1282863 RepID=A0ABY4DP23_9NEIS|nr:hypothetical protein [Uruburuella testudinis]UOO80807.1 hypothetical protein LVJ83_07355 [Uruburuella testudinis]
MFIIFLAAATILPTTAVADSRIDRLERTVAELGERIRKLEQQNRQQHIIIENRQTKQPVYACNVSVFGHSYEASADNEGIARQQVRKACAAEQNAMFCTDREIKCRKYP